MKFDENYLLGILKQLEESYNFFNQLQDKPGDLNKIRKEWAKVYGFVQVLVKKLEFLSNKSDDYVILSRSAKKYLENFDFENEIETMSKLYSEDPDRLRNIRLAILDSLLENKFMESISNIIAKNT